VTRATFVSGDGSTAGAADGAGDAGATGNVAISGRRSVVSVESIRATVASAFFGAIPACGFCGMRMTSITAIAQPTAAAIAGFPVHQVVGAARFEALARGRCFIRIDRFTGIRILLGSVLDIESADPPSRMGNSNALRRGWGQL
jgi:hypothetical protein